MLLNYNNLCRQKYYHDLIKCHTEIPKHAQFIWFYSKAHWMVTILLAMSVCEQALPQTQNWIQITLQEIYVMWLSYD